MRVLKITVLTHCPGGDRVTLETDLPSPWTPPDEDDRPLSLSFEGSRERTLDYVQKTFPGVPITVVDARTGARREIKAG